MFQWLRELRDILREPKLCQSCEVLKTELANMRREKDILLSKVLTPSVQEDRVQAPEPLSLQTRHIPWRVKQQKLEAEDRAQHQRIMQEFQNKVKSAEEIMGVKQDDGNQAAASSKEA